MMYKAKSEGKNLIIPTDQDVVEVFRATGEKTIVVMKAIEEKTLIPYFQPIINMKTGRVEGHEVLSRIRTDNGLLEAEEFIEVAERLGVVSKLDYIVMEKVFRKVKDEGYEGYLFINLSPKSLILREFIPGVLKLTGKYEIDHCAVVFEITERDTVKNVSLLEKFVHELKREGFKFAIDDFGSGFSSFHYIKRFNVDFVKIEGEFIKKHDRGQERSGLCENHVATGRGTRHTNRRRMRGRRGNTGDDKAARHRLRPGPSYRKAFTGTDG